MLDKISFPVPLRVVFMKDFKLNEAHGPAVRSLSSVLALTGDSCAVGWISELIQLKRNLTPLQK